MDLFLALRLCLGEVTHVHDAECDVSGLVLRSQPVDSLFGLVVRHQLTHSEDGQDCALSRYVEPGRHLGEVPGEVYAADDSAGGHVGTLHQPAAVGECALAEYVEVSRLVHDLRDKEHSRLEVVGRCARDPTAGDVSCDKLNLSQERCELALCALDIVGKWSDRVPGNVGCRAPLALQRLFVQHCGVDQPDVGLRAHLVPADAVGVGPGSGAPWPAGHVVGRWRRIAVATDLDVGQGQPLLAVSGRLDAPLAMLIEPVELQPLVVRVLLDAVEVVVDRGHMRPPHAVCRKRTIASKFGVGNGEPGHELSTMGTEGHELDVELSLGDLFGGLGPVPDW